MGRLKVHPEARRFYNTIVRPESIQLLIGDNKNNETKHELDCSAPTMQNI